MKRTFHINNYLNQKASQASSREQEQSRLPQSRSEKLDYYEQYLEKYQLQHSESASPYHPSSSPIKRTTTAQTAEISYKPNTTRSRQTPIRKASEESQFNLTTQRIYNDRPERNHSAIINPSQSSAAKSEKQWQLQLEININKLKDIKSFLENQISMLQQLLDETSQSLQNIDTQFEKIKEKVLDFTSRSLDAAFSKYKRQMTRWSKYEDVEKKSLEVVLEVRDYIREGQKVLEQLRQGTNTAALANSLKEVANRVEHYQQTTNEIRRVRQQCLAKHPTLREEKVLEFERVLEELCCF